MRIDNRNLFLDRIKTGINIFAGAGFSVLKNSDGVSLPTIDELMPNICQKFNITSSYSGNIEMVSSVLKRNSKDEFYAYLREMFFVKKYNDLYDALNNVSIKSFITTNIDNLFQTVINNSSRYYINEVFNFGVAKHKNDVVNYIPLHGSVELLESELYFGKFELNMVGNRNRQLFESAKADMYRYPTLFWGYGFHDGSVLDAIGDVLQNGTQDIWIMCRDGSEKIEFFRDMGLNVIVGDTDELLRIMKKDLPEYVSESDMLHDNSCWATFAIPNLQSVESLPVEQYYRQGNTHWYYILTRKAYETSLVKQIINFSLEEKNIVVVGMPFGGKTTLLMQVAVSYGKEAYYVDRLSTAQAKLLIKNIKDSQEAILLVDNCADDMEAFALLAKRDNIKLIGGTDEHLFEQSRHLLEGIKFKRINMADIDENEAKRIYYYIPKEYRCKSFVYKDDSADKYSMLELFAKNVKGVIKKGKIKEILQRIKNVDVNYLEIVLLTAYMVKHKSALSVDVLYYFLGSNITYKKIQHKLHAVNNLLTELDVKFYEDVEDQDYYKLRSNLFAAYTDEVGRKYFREVYRNVVSKLILQVPFSNIYRYDLFKRTAFDSDIFYELFVDEADELYNQIYNYDASGYAKQQMALYKAKSRRFAEAFADIDSASNMLPNNFSIKNTKAIIMFEANQDKNTPEALAALQDSMKQLDDCYHSDQRKVYHVQKYAEFAMALARKHSINQYLDNAKAWLEGLINKGDSISHKTKKLLSSVNKLLEQTEV